MGEIPPVIVEAAKKKLPLWLKAVIGVVVVGGGVSVMAGIGVKMVKGYFAEKAGHLVTGREEGPDDEEEGEFDQERFEKALEKGFKEAGIPIDFNLKTGGIAVKDDKSGQTLFATKPTGDVPRDFPADIPVFQPSTVSGSMLMGPNKSLHLETDKPMTEVADFYRQAMPERGWQEDQTPQVFGPSPMSNWIKGQRQVSIVATPPEDGKTLILINMNEKPGANQQLGVVPIPAMNEQQKQEMQKGMQQFQQMMDQLNKMQQLPAQPTK
ncbi:MAG: hypothetical protein HYT77_07540 [Deltaproteobacteria bacterium]|nr:hypothetical protein [Deltaproteobacteria bacterium]